MFGSSEGSKKKSYTWWKDLISSDYNMAGSTFSFSNNINFRVDDVMSIFFWYDIWVCDSPLKDIFPELYSIHNKKEAFVCNMGCWSDGNWYWGDFGLTGQE
ncbi:unnamed protein product [Lathyrus oleraceus]